jgi:hypothetical protein
MAEPGVEFIDEAGAQAPDYESGTTRKSENALSRADSGKIPKRSADPQTSDKSFENRTTVTRRRTHFIDRTPARHEAITHDVHVFNPPISPESGS